MTGAVSRRELIRKFRALGFTGPFPGKRHQFTKKDQLKVRTPNPHKAGAIGEPLVREILRQAGIGRDHWERA